jgi:hypothetical protein
MKGMTNPPMARVPAFSPSPGTPGEGWGGGSLRDRADSGPDAGAANPHPTLPRSTGRGKWEAAPIRRLALRGFVVVILFLIAFPTRRAWGQVSVARELVEQATEQIFKSAGREGLEQLGAMGGRNAVREVLEQSSREGGEQLVKRVTQYGVEEGPAALRAIRFAPAKMVNALDGLSPELRQAGLRAVERDPQALTNLVKQYGSGAIEVAARHPGVGEELVGKLGSDGIALGRKLTTDQSIVAARCADDLAALGPAERQGVLAKILQSPKPVLDYLETHPRILRTAAGVALVMAVKDDILGDRGHTVVGPDGKLLTTPAHPGLIERILPQSLHAASGPASIIGTAVAFGVLGWFAVHLLGKWRLQKRAR